MTTIKARLLALEQHHNESPALVLSVTDRPTPEQQAEIERATRTGRRLIVFYMPGDTAWMPGCGVPPWETDEGMINGND